MLRRHALPLLPGRRRKKSLVHFELEFGWLLYWELSQLLQCAAADGRNLAGTRNGEGGSEATGDN